MTNSSDCIEWWGLIDRNGYGKGYFGKRVEWAHRAIYEACFGFIPYGMQIDHVCRNKTCVNPAHLEVVTPKENTQRHFRLQTHCRQGHSFAEFRQYINPNGTKKCSECAREYERKRSGFGKRKPTLKEWQIKRICFLYSNGVLQRKIAEVFGISQSYVSIVVLKFKVKRGGKKRVWSCKEEEVTLDQILGDAQ